MGKKPYDIVNDFVATGNKAIDGVASCIIWHRQRKIALKAIHLNPKYYDWFRLGVELLQRKQLEEGQLMTLDGVNIEKGSRFQSVPILPQFWESASEN